MYVRIFKCNCGIQFESQSYSKCPLCGSIQTIKNLQSGRASPDGKKDKTIISGDFKKFFSPDLGVVIESSTQLNRELKKRNMVNLMESKDYRDHEKMLSEKIKDFPSVRNCDKSN